MKKGRICLNWKGKVVGQVSPVEGHAFFPFVPFEDKDAEEEKFNFVPLQNTLDLEMLEKLREDGIKFIGFPVDECIKEQKRQKVWK